MKVFVYNKDKNSKKIATIENVASVTQRTKQTVESIFQRVKVQSNLTQNSLKQASIKTKLQKLTYRLYGERLEK